MIDYYPLIARAVEALEENTPPRRRVVYEEARSMLIRQLRSVDPALRESDITKERLRMERAIRKVEIEESETDSSRRALIGLARHIETLLQEPNVRAQLKRAIDA